MWTKSPPNRPDVKSRVGRLPSETASGLSASRVCPLHVLAVIVLRNNAISVTAAGMRTHEDSMKRRESSSRPPVRGKVTLLR